MRLQCIASSRHKAHASSATLARPAGMKLAPRAKEFSGLLDLFPAVRHAFAYGSGIFVQPGLYAANSKVGGPMLDFIFAVDSPEEWHNQNISQNGHHYSSLSWLGGRAVSCNAEKLGAGVHFNAAVPWGSQVIKYGVVCNDGLCRDLEVWDRLYIAGRLQKPVLTLKGDPLVKAANERNQASALVASLLLLPKQFTAEDLCRMIVELSYLGDVRMGIAEDSRKIDRIASGSSDGLKKIYMPLLADEQLQRAAGVSCTEEDAWQQDCQSDGRCELIARLPQTVRVRLAQRVGLSGEVAVTHPDKVAGAVVASGQHQKLLRSSIASIVGPSSRGQAVAGLFMAGATRSAWYVLEKLKKKWA